MIFKSKQVNLDPEPWKCYQTGERQAEPGHHPDFDPRPEFEPTRDPMPVIHHHAECILNGERLEGLAFSGDEWAPRREHFDTPVNPILADFRRVWIGEPDFMEAVEFWRDGLDEAGQDGPDQWTENYSVEEIDHAHRVLSRLAALA